MIFFILILGILMKNHNLEEFFQNFLLGKQHHIPKISVFKRAMLTGYLSILVVVMCFFYIIFDAFMGILDATLFYLTLINFGVIAFLLNKTGRYESAKSLLLAATLLIILLFGATEPIDSGNYLNFFPLTVAAFALFGYKSIIKGILFTAISLLAFLLIYFFDFSILPQRPAIPEIQTFNFLIHFFVSMIATVLIIIFLIKLNHTIETNLMEKDKHLTRTTDELLKSQQRFELAITGSNAGIYDWDIQKNKIYHSPMWKMLLGYDQDELEDFDIDTFFEFVHPKDVGKVKKSLRNHLDDGSRYAVELRLRTKGGKYKWFSDSGQALWNKKGQPVRMVGSIIKIHERKTAEEHIRKQNKMLKKTNLELDNFVYSASHDIRSPLTSILGLINIAAQARDKEEIDKCLTLMRTRVNRLDEVIEDILDFSKNIRLEKKYREINLAYFIDELLNNHEFGDNYKKLDIQLTISSDFEVITDPMRLKVIAKNLISNSVKFMNKNHGVPWLRISALRADTHFLLIFEDNGEGIREELQDKVFDMFYRASEKSKGSGLGLYIVKEMVENLHGTIKLRSTYGEGTTIIIELPDHRHQASAKNEEGLANPISPETV